MSTSLRRFAGSVMEAALTPHPVDRYLELVDPGLTWRDLRAKVTGVARPTSRTVRLTLAPTRQWRGHQAGQYVQLSIVIDGVRHTRCFSPANASSGPRGYIELTVTAHDGGFVSTYLRDHAHVGMVVGLSQAAGDFTLPDTLRSAVFISGGSGITPVLSMVRTLVSTGFDGPMTFVHYARSADDLSYAAELAALPASHPTDPSLVEVVCHYTRVDGGHFTDDHLDSIPGVDEADVFVCGPSALMDAVATHHNRAGHRGRLHSEAFTLASVSAADLGETATGELTFSRSGSSTANDGRTILDQAESAGLSPESGCRMGICFSCTAIKKSGCTRNVLTGETDTEADTQIQLCINAPVGDVEIEV